MVPAQRNIDSTDACTKVVTSYTRSDTLRSRNGYSGAGILLVWQPGDFRPRYDCAGKGTTAMNRLQLKEALFRIVVAGNGIERIAVPCATEQEAVAYIRGFNSINGATGLMARGLEVSLPRLKRNPARQIQ